MHWAGGRLPRVCLPRGVSARGLSAWGGGVCLGKGCLPGEGVSAGGVCPCGQNHRQV